MSAGIHARGADLSCRDVTIKIPDRGYDQGWEWRHTPEAWAAIWEKSVSLVPAWEEDGWLSGLVVARRICALRAPRVSWVESWRCKSSQHGRVVSLTPYVEKPFNSKVIKSFVPELRSRQVLFVFLDSDVIYIWTLWTFCVQVWICLFRVSISDYVTRASHNLFSSVGRSWRKRRLHPFPHKQRVHRVWHSIAPDGEDPLLELRRMWSTTSLPLFLGPLLFELVVPVRVPSKSQTELFNPFQRIIINYFKYCSWVQIVYIW